MDELKKIKEFYSTHKRMPSYSELRKIFGYASRTTGVRLAQKLIAADVLRKDETGRLRPGSRFYFVKVLGTVVAGWPSPAEEELSDTMSLDEYLIENKDATYMLKISGDSMIDEGIKDGDMVLVERGVTAKDGDIVVAEVDGKWTVKYLRKVGRRVYLEAANKKYGPIYPKEELKVAAIVKAVIRKY